MLNWCIILGYDSAKAHYLPLPFTTQLKKENPMPSFDIVSELQTFEVKHAVQNTEKEIATRFDFKGSDIKIELNEKDKKLTITADNDLQIENVYAMLEKHLIKRGVDLQSLDPQDIKGSGKQVKQEVKLKDGLDSDTAKKISKALKESDLKISGSIQGDKVRVTDKKKDTLQQAMTFLKEKQFGVPLQFNNFKD